MQTNILQKSVSQGSKKARQQTENERRRAVRQTVRGGGSKAVYAALNTTQKAQFARELEEYYRRSQNDSGDHLSKQTAARKSKIGAGSTTHISSRGRTLGGSSGSFGEALGYGKAIGGGIEAGLWNGAVRGPLDLGASKIGQKISSDDTDTWLGKSTFQKEREINAAFLGRLGSIWGGYEAGDGSFGQNLKDTVFAGYNSAFQNLLEGTGRSPLFPGSESREAMYLGSNALFHALKEYALPAITGSRDKDYNARWLTETAYEASDRLTEKVSSIPGLKYVDAEKYQKDLAASSPSVRLAGNVSSVVANMLPAIGISAATKSPDAALVAISATAAGNAAKEAYESGATPEQAYYIGLEKGYVEYLTERMFDALGAFGGGTLTPGMESLLGEYAATKGGRALIKAGGILGEHVEEGVADWAGTGIERAVLGHTIGEEPDKTLAQAMAGQAPWTEEGLVTLLSTLALNGGSQIIKSATPSQEKAASPAQQANEAAYLRRMEEIGYLPAESSKNAARDGAAEESTAVNTDPAKHTAVEQAVIDEYQASVDETLKEFIQQYISSSRSYFKRKNLTRVSDRQAADAARLLGGDYSGYQNAINTNCVRHIIKEHGSDGTVDHSMSDINDLSRLSFVLSSYDSVERAVYASGEPKTSKEFRNADDSPAPMLLYKKKVNGTYYIVEAVPDSKYKKFWVVSAYMDKSEGGTQAPDG